MSEIHLKTSITLENLECISPERNKIQKPWLTVVKVKYGQLQSQGANCDFKGVHSFQPMPCRCTLTPRYPYYKSQSGSLQALHLHTFSYVGA